jgi:hypothetical protein
MFSNLRYCSGAFGEYIIPILSDRRVPERLESFDHVLGDVNGRQLVRLETQNVRQQEFTARDTLQV